MAERLKRLWINWSKSIKWQGNKEGKGYNLMNWKIVILSKGKGVWRSETWLRLQNESLPMKWLWRYTGEGGSSLEGGYNSKIWWAESLVYRKCHWTIWCVCGEQSETWGHRWKKIYYQGGNGNWTRFWKDGCIDQTSLRDLFPNLLLICENLDARVCDCLTEQGWNNII